MTLRKNLKQINLHFFSVLTAGLLKDMRTKGVLMELQTKKIKDKISVNCLKVLRIKNQAVFPYEE